MSLASRTLGVFFLAVAATAVMDPATAQTLGGTRKVADIPPRYLALYRAAADTCTQLEWSLLAGIGKVETDHGRTPLPGVRSGANAAGAMGPMQFLGPTFAAVRARHPEVGSDVYDPRHAIPATAHYLCDSGLRGGNEYAAIFAYNHADWYVAKVRAQAARYRSAAGGGR
jgi:hypothetical protein